MREERERKQRRSFLWPNPKIPPPSLLNSPHTFSRRAHFAEIFVEFSPYVCPRNFYPPFCLLVEGVSYYEYNRPRTYNPPPWEKKNQKISFGQNEFLPTKFLTQISNTQPLIAPSSKNSWNLLENKRAKNQYGSRKFIYWWSTPQSTSAWKKHKHFFRNLHFISPPHPYFVPITPLWLLVLPFGSINKIRIVIIILVKLIIAWKKKPLVLCINVAIFLKRISLFFLITFLRLFSSFFRTVTIILFSVLCVLHCEQLLFYYQLQQQIILNWLFLFLFSSLLYPPTIQICSCHC